MSYVRDSQNVWDGLTPDDLERHGYTAEDVFWQQMLWVEDDDVVRDEQMYGSEQVGGSSRDVASLRPALSAAKPAAPVIPSSGGGTTAAGVQAPRIGTGSVVMIGGQLPVVASQPGANAPEPIQLSGNPPEILSPNGTALPQIIEESLPGCVFSEDSGFAPFETIWNDLDLVAEAGYNFWEPGEETTAPERGIQVVEDMPRFIHLSWRQAPDLRDPRQFQKKRLEGPLPDTRTRFTPLSPFGFGAREVVGVNAAGRSWTPSSLQPQNFRQNALATANGFLAPGVVEAVATVLTGSVTVPPMPTAELVDEDEFLARSELFEGISYPEFNAAAWRWKSRVYGLQQGLRGSLSERARADRQSLAGQFSIAPSRQNLLEIRSNNSSGPAISVQTATAASMTPQDPSRVFELGAQIGLPDLRLPASEGPESHEVKVKFIHTNLQGLIREDRINAISLPEQAETITAIAPFVANLAVYAYAGYQVQHGDLSIPAFAAPADLKPLEYVGYVIEKYEQINGSFRLIDTLYIPGREYDEYYDTRVKYGAVYRYRIKAILRWARPVNKNVLGYDPTTTSTPLNGLNEIAPFRASYFESEWSKRWASATVIDTSPPAWPEDFRVRPCSGEGYIEITFRLPYNPQGDISKMTVLRKIQDEYGNDVTGWVQLREYNAEDRQGTKLEMITENLHEQDDLTGVNILSKEGAKISPFVEFAPMNARYVDTDVAYFGEGSRFKYVYAAQCWSRHGEQSYLSDQLAARLNSHWQKEGEYLVELVSTAGVDKDFDTGVFIRYPERRIRSEVVAPLKPETSVKLEFSGQSRLAKRALKNSTYTARIESLDTGQHVDVPVQVRVVNMPEQVIEEGMTVLTTF